MSCLCSHIFPISAACVEIEGEPLDDFWDRAELEQLSSAPTPCPLSSSTSVTGSCFRAWEYGSCFLYWAQPHLCVWINIEQSRRGVLGVGTCVASSGPWQPRRFQFHTVVLKKKSPGFPNLLFPGWMSRFLNMTLNWAWVWDPPTYSNRSLLKHEKIQHHHHFCRGWPYWFHSPFAWIQPICLCRDHEWLLDSFIGEETGSEGRDAFTKWPHHWFQKSWNLGEERLCAFQKSTNWIYKHLKLWHWEVNTGLTVGLTSAE